MRAMQIALPPSAQKDDLLVFADHRPSPDPVGDLYAYASKPLSAVAAFSAFLIALPVGWVSVLGFGEMVGFNNAFDVVAGTFGVVVAGGLGAWSIWRFFQIESDFLKSRLRGDHVTIGLKRHLGGVAVYEGGEHVRDIEQTSHRVEVERTPDAEVPGLLPKEVLELHFEGRKDAKAIALGLRPMVRNMYDVVTVCGGQKLVLSRSLIGEAEAFARRAEIQAFLDQGAAPSPSSMSTPAGEFSL